MFRIGNGYDVHRLEAGRKLIIGGVCIPHETGLLGHSDADVLAHAITDSVLGACGMGDIGKMFPDTDETYKNADSIKLLETVCNKIKEQCYSVVNIDSIIVAQKPMMAPFLDEMRKNIAAALDIDIGNVNIKATTEEKLGFTGAEQGISAHAVCFVEKMS